MKAGLRKSAAARHAVQKRVNQAGQSDGLPALMTTGRPLSSSTRSTCGICGAQRCCVNHRVLASSSAAVAAARKHLPASQR